MIAFLLGCVAADPLVLREPADTGIPPWTEVGPATRSEEQDDSPATSTDTAMSTDTATDTVTQTDTATEVETDTPSDTTIDTATGTDTATEPESWVCDTDQPPTFLEFDAWCDAGVLYVAWTLEGEPALFRLQAANSIGVWWGFDEEDLDTPCCEDGALANDGGALQCDLYDYSAELGSTSPDDPMNWWECWQFGTTPYMTCPYWEGALGVTCEP